MKRKNVTDYERFVSEGKESQQQMHQRLAFGNLQKIADQYQIKLSTGEQLLKDLEKIAYTSYVTPHGENFKPSKEVIMELYPWNVLAQDVKKLLDQVGNLEIFTNPELYKIWVESSYNYTDDPKVIAYMKKVRTLSDDLNELCTSSSAVQDILHNSLGYDNRTDEFNQAEIEYALSKT